MALPAVLQGHVETAAGCWAALSKHDRAVQQQAVGNIISHEDDDEKNHDNDLALLHLALSNVCSHLASGHTLK